MTVACEYERLRDGFLFRPDSSFSTVGAAEDYPYFCYKLWQWQWLKRMIKSTMMMTSTWWRRRRGVGGKFWEKVLFADKIFDQFQMSKVFPDLFFFQFSNVKPGGEGSGLLEKGLQRSYPVSVSIVISIIIIGIFIIIIVISIIYIKLLLYS